MWTTYTYDGSGRTLTVKVGATDASGGGAAGTTTYTYPGNQTKVTDAAGKWKIFTTDAFGNLTAVTEPDPRNDRASTLTCDGGSNLITCYTYNTANQLTQVTMPRTIGTGTAVQTRTFVWTGSDLTSATNPENGTGSYTYDGGHRVTSRSDAKLQQTGYTYDGYGRLKEVRHCFGKFHDSPVLPE